MSHKKQGRFEPPGKWERDVPYDIRERTFQFAVRLSWTMTSLLHWSKRATN